MGGEDTFTKCSIFICSWVFFWNFYCVLSVCLKPIPQSELQTWHNVFIFSRSNFGLASVILIIMFTLSSVHFFFQYALQNHFASVHKTSCGYFLGEGTDFLKDLGLSDCWQSSLNLGGRQGCSEASHSCNGSDFSFCHIFPVPTREFSVIKGSWNYRGPTQFPRFKVRDPKGIVHRATWWAVFTGPGHGHFQWTWSCPLYKGSFSFY